MRLIFCVFHNHGRRAFLNLIKRSDYLVFFANMKSLGGERNIGPTQFTSISSERSLLWAMEDDALRRNAAHPKHKVH